jgi:glycosyltransferase involved in cell wall biosynthesis
LHQEHRLPEKYLYLPNQFWAHKNHITVLKSLVTLRDQYRIIVPLVCSGAQSDRRNSSHFSKLREFIREHNLADQVWFLGLVPRAEQIDVFRRAAAVVQPSLFEGWSTVVEDTRAIGRPIFLSDIPVHREQAPPNGSFFSPESHEALAALLAETWAHLRPGPDLDAEAAALKQTRIQVRESALEFCRIAREALEAKGFRPSLGTG